MRISGDRGLYTLTAWLEGLARRRDAIADNIANVDTPGYRRREGSFETELARELSSSRPTLLTTPPRHLQPPSVRSGQAIQAARRLVSSRMDGNDVDIDQEMVLLVETQARYQAAAQALARKFEQLRNAIRTV